MILVIDLEATCSNDGSIPSDEMEIIEIGACWAEQNGVIVDRFQSFVRPAERSVLTEFCSKLTGIQQRDIDAAPIFAVAAEALKVFIDAYTEPSTVWMSWGAYDRKQIELEVARHAVPSPILLPHINAKKQFAKQQRIGKEVGMSRALVMCRLDFIGTHHRALDDAINIARLLPWVLGEKFLREERKST